jgi:hypothetical protein
MKNQPIKTKSFVECNYDQWINLNFWGFVGCFWVGENRMFVKRLDCCENLDWIEKFRWLRFETWQENVPLVVVYVCDNSFFFIFFNPKFQQNHMEIAIIVLLFQFHRELYLKFKLLGNRWTFNPNAKWNWKYLNVNSDCFILEIFLLSI